MDVLPEIPSLVNWQIAATIMVFGAYLLVSLLTARLLSRSVDEGGFKEDASQRVSRITRLLAGVIGTLALVIIWGLKITSVLVFAGTTLTLLGVALFASWSILSNITAYFILVLHPKFKRGTFVRLLDADNYAEGYIAELGLLSIKLISEQRAVILYPNNLVLARPCLVNPRDRMLGVGKLPPVQSTEEPCD